ncbi:MAG: NADH-quinone oxidoreductase subunit K [Pelovirga sp.]
MTAVQLYLSGGIVLFFIGLHALLAHHHLLRKILAANILGSGVFMVFIALAARSAPAATDPVPQALVLTGIIVSLCFTAVAVVLAVRIHRLSGCTTLAQEESAGD